MNRYTVKVLDDDTGNESVFVIESPRPLDRRTLQLAGLILDNGCSPEFIRSELPVAESYVEVEGDTVAEQWIGLALEANDAE